MRFSYTYRSSDGQRHTAEIDAENRDEAFSAVRRELGVKPIKVVALDGSKSNGAISVRQRFPLRMFIGVIASVLLAAWVAYCLGMRSEKSKDMIVIDTPQGRLTSRIAEPLARQTIPGNRQRVEKERDIVFTNAAERLLSQFAEPGRGVNLDAARPQDAEFMAALREPIRILSNELTEHADLKRIVEGMKNELKAYLAGGGTVDGYLAELAKRQKLEMSYREHMEQKLNDLLVSVIDEKRNSDQSGNRDAQDSRTLNSAYAYWLKANAQLQAMGIHPLSLPDVLRSYQLRFDLNEENKTVSPRHVKSQPVDVP